MILALYTYTSGLRAPAMIAFVKDIMIYIVVIAAIWLIPSKLGGYAHVFDAADQFFKAKGGATGIILKADAIHRLRIARAGIGARRVHVPAHHDRGAFVIIRCHRQEECDIPACLHAAAGFDRVVGLYGYRRGHQREIGLRCRPALFGKLFPSWFVGFAAAAIAISALVPAAIMSIGAG